MIKKNSGTLKFMISNEIYYYVGSYYKIFGKFIFHKGILIKVDSSILGYLTSIKTYLRYSFVPKECGNYTKEEDDIYSRIKLYNIIKKYKYYSDISSYYNIDELLELTWDEKIIKDNDLKFYILYHYNDNNPSYVFGQKKNNILKGLRIYSKGVPTKFMEYTKDFEICEPLMLKEDILNIEDYINRHEFELIVGSQIKKSMEKLINKILKEEA